MKKEAAHIRRGRIGERIARNFLERRGFELLNGISNCTVRKLTC